jgi:uncharacterized MAPEG superfamily protein
VSLALWCLCAATLLPYGLSTTAKLLTIRKTGRFDNRDPRAFLASAEGAGLRAHNAQLNSFEALPGFVAGVLTATVMGVDVATLDGLALAWIGLRVVYALLYILDRPTLRSMVWFAALLIVVAMFWLSACAG